MSIAHGRCPVHALLFLFLFLALFLCKQACGLFVKEIPFCFDPGGPLIVRSMGYIEMQLGMASSQAAALTRAVQRVHETVCQVMLAIQIFAWAYIRAAAYKRNSRTSPARSHNAFQLVPHDNALGEVLCRPDQHRLPQRSPASLA